MITKLLPNIIKMAVMLTHGGALYFFPEHASISDSGIPTAGSLPHTHVYDLCVHPWTLLSTLVSHAMSKFRLHCFLFRVEKTIELSGKSISFFLVQSPYVGVSTEMLQCELGETKVICQRTWGKRFRAGVSPRMEHKKGRLLHWLMHAVLTLDTSSQVSSFQVVLCSGCLHDTCGVKSAIFIIQFFLVLSFSFLAW